MPDEPLDPEEENLEPLEPEGEDLDELSPLDDEDLKPVNFDYGSDDDTLDPNEIANLISGGAEEDEGENEVMAGIAEVLDQDSIDAMMAETLDGQREKIFSYTGKLFEQETPIAIVEYDFCNPVFMTEAEMRQVRIRHEKFVHLLSARLSMFLRMDFSMKMSKLFTTQFKTHVESIDSPTHISLFKLQQFNGVGIIDMNSRLAMTIVDRMLGGGGHSIRDERFLTEMETLLVEDIIKILLDEWCKQWDDMFEVNASIVGSENNGRFLQVSAHDAIMLVTNVEATLGDCSEVIQIAIPYYTIEPVIKRMQDDAKKNNPNATKRKEYHWWESYEDIGVEVTAEWDAFECSVRDLLNIRKGDLIMLKKDLIDNTKIRCKNNTCFMAKVGLQDEQVCVELNEKIEKEPVYANG